MLTVAIWGATGFMGAPFSRALIQAHRAGHLRFVILHRPQSDTTMFPADVERRNIDFENIDVSSASEKISDLQVVVSAVSWRAGTAQYRLIDALKGSKKLVTFFPSDYATPHSEEDMKSPYLAYSREKLSVFDYCTTHGVPYTRLANATLPQLLFSLPGFSSFNIHENTLNLYWPPGEGKRGLTSADFSGKALVHLLRNRLADLPNQAFSLVEISFTARNLIDMFTKLHDGKEPTINKYTEEQYQRDLNADFLSAMGAASKKGLCVGVSWPGEIVSSFPGWEQKTLESYGKACLESKPVSLGGLRDYTDLSKE